jgi:hypothetical protein
LYVGLVRLYLAHVEIVCNIIIFISNCLLRIKIRNYFFITRICISSGSYLEQLLILTYQQQYIINGSKTAADGSLESPLMNFFLVVCE